VDDKNDIFVEETQEPNIATRFGFQQLSSPSSSRTVKLSVAAVIVCVVAIFLIKSPDAPESQSTVKVPENAQVSEHQNLNLSEYSQTAESEKIQDQNKKRTAGIIVRFPGLQKIDRRSGQKVPPGSIIRAVLVTGASNGSVRAEAKESLRVQGETLIPEGTVLLGSGQSTEERLFIRFSQLVFKDGTSQSIQAQAADSSDKTVGLKGSKVGRYALKYAAAVGLNFASGMAEGFQDHDVVNNQVVSRPDAKNALLNGASKSALEMANETMTDLKNNAPVIQVESGKEILILFESAQ